MWDAFQDAYLPADARHRRSQPRAGDQGRRRRPTITAQLVVDGEHRTVTGEGNGPIAAFVHALRDGLGHTLDVVDYAEHAISSRRRRRGRRLRRDHRRRDGVLRWGVGTDPNIITASLRAVLCAVRRHRPDR